MPSYFVTGANKGIGKATVQKILEQKEEAFVYLGSRSLENGEKAVEELGNVNEGWRERLKVVEIDISEEKSVEEAFNGMKKDLEENKEREPLLGLVNNAGIFSRSDMKLCLDVNVRGTRHVTQIFSRLLHPTEGRVVIVSSIGGPNFLSMCNSKTQKRMTDGSMNWDDLEELMSKVEQEYKFETKKFSPALRSLGIFSKLQYSKSLMAPYIFSKACSNASTIILAREFPDLSINCCNPGAIWSDMTVTLNEKDEKKMKKKGLLSPEEGTVAIMYLLTSDKVDGNGDYYNADATKGPMVQAPKGSVGKVIKVISKLR